MAKQQTPKREMPKVKKGTLGRVIKLLMEDYKGMLLLALACMALYSIGNISPSVFIKRITDIIITFSRGGTWDEVRPLIGRVLAVMILALTVTIVFSYLYARIMAVITQGLSLIHI